MTSFFRASRRGNLGDFAIAFRRRCRIYDKSDFGARSNRKLGITALFAGTRGRDKIMGAEVLAGELRREL